MYSKHCRDRPGIVEEINNTINYYDILLLRGRKQKKKGKVILMNKKSRFVKIISLVLAIVAMSSVFIVSASAATTPPNRTKAVATSRLNTLISRLEGKYFTTNDNIYRYNRGSNCCNANVIQSSWLKNTMGLVPNSAGLMPIHYTNGLGGYITSTAYSCAGFANYCL